MADHLDDGGFWLPSEFLADDMFMEKKNRVRVGVENETRVCFPGEFPYGFGSYGSTLSSPVESVVGSTETESDEEDYIAGLTQQMVRSTLQDEEKIAPPAFSKGFVTGSPQSTLCAVNSWLGCSHGSSRESSNGQSQFSSPPSTPMYQKEDDAWDLLYAAAGQVVRMKMNNEALKFHGRGVLGPPNKLSSAASVPVKTHNLGFCPNQALTQQQLRVNQFQLLKQQQMIKQQQCSAAWGRQVAKPEVQNQHQCRVGGFGNGRSGRPLGLSSSAWPPLQQQQHQQQQQQQPSSGMRAVFLGGSGTRKESCGTGVFLPRRAGDPNDMRKKPACSTVLLPARVVQALNLNLDEVGTALPRFQHDQDGHAMLGMSNTHLSLQQQQQRHNIRTTRPTPTNHHEIRLPPDWTY